MSIPVLWVLTHSLGSPAEKMFGYPPESVIGENISMLMPEPHRTKHDDYILNYLTTGKAKIIGIYTEVEALHQNGWTFPISLAVGQVHLEKQILFTGIVRDITERKAFEEEQTRNRKKLLKLSHQAGRAEVATSVLHNGGNVLNSINVTSTTMLSNIKKSRTNSFAKIIETLPSDPEEFGHFVTTDEKGKRLREYLSTFTKILLEEQ